MHFHWRTERAARGLGEVVLGFIAIVAVCLPDPRKLPRHHWRRSPAFAKASAWQTKLRNSVTDGGSETAAPCLLTAHCAPVYSRSRRGIEALQSRMVLVVH
jgi:hypothetical protein